MSDENLSNCLVIASRSDAGMVRTHNEDAVFVSASSGLIVLADGMGGYNAGEVAAGMAISLLGGELEKSIATRRLQRNGLAVRADAQALLESHVASANSAIYEAAQSQPQYAGMGTTLVMGLFYDNAVTFAHIGDSRAYRFREGRLEQLTRDHSLLQEQIDSGMITLEEARLSQNRNLVTRALGVDPAVQAEIRDFDTTPGDIYLLCSDGLNDMVCDGEIAHIVGKYADDPEDAAARLIQQANENGGRDNVSVILIRIAHEYPASRGLLARLLAWFR
ncbi:MAG TPA: Stp1/IreP family PP2C-type Ser/Thr phosphatase [Rhodocyclaceae bacterium]|nr:Stp1/IreP family PP2C-type Ser/Thr phosphatase [Rhodocyclaceae bacterium]HMZ83041.1 Stp1/IreP family PP2C-type Ser/Thr phosphatase [Rhodocyclaceae bacterium]HNC60813.1 Stp1/IreP family PP2C-type Ser/Thr phosphatase [Rhodocyclaceae bacterium]